MSASSTALKSASPCPPFWACTTQVQDQSVGTLSANPETKCLMTGCTPAAFKNVMPTTIITLTMIMMIIIRIMVTHVLI